MRPDEAPAAQLQIEVPPAPNAIGRWSLEHELQAYAEHLGAEALERQKRLAREARECTCGKQERTDNEARERGEKSRRLLGHEHLPGCNSFRDSQPKLIRRISADEQRARYEEEQRVDQLRDLLARHRSEEEA